MSRRPKRGSVPYPPRVANLRTPDHFEIGRALAALHRRVYPDRDLRPGEQATELNDLEAALARFRETEDFVSRLLRRMEPYLELPRGSRVLDVGSAQGISVAAFTKAGFVTSGAEPWQPAIATSREVARRLGIDFELLHGRAESLPFPSASFELVHAYSVMEHLDDAFACFREAYRVLVPGGGFFFSTTSALCPRQGEIRGFPLFPWYPSKLRRRILDWAARERPWLVGYTDTPAYSWFRHRWVREALRSIGFRRVVDRWALRKNERTGWQRLLIHAAAENRGFRFIGDVAVGGMEYLAIK
jgi:SAM-dependent methyltransferase